MFETAEATTSETRVSETYLPGFGNHFATEAVAGALPVGPQLAAARAVRPLRRAAVRHRLHRAARREPALAGSTACGPPPTIRRSCAYAGRAAAALRPVRRGAAPPNRLRWDPLPLPDAPTDFVDGLITYGGNGDVATGAASGIHLYAANRSMEDRVFFDADGELLIVPQQGALRLVTELGGMTSPRARSRSSRAACASASSSPTGRRAAMSARITARLFRLPDLGPIGSNGLANPRDFETPVASFEDVDEPVRARPEVPGRALDDHARSLAARRRRLARQSRAVRYDLARFNTIDTVSFDHPDPSIFTVLTSPSDMPGTANCDFVIFPPRWMVAEDTFRPPWFHRNVMSEFMGLIDGAYDAKADGFAPGGASLHNQMSGHGPDRASYEKAIAAELKPHKIEDTMAFMFESRYVIRPTRWAMETPLCSPTTTPCGRASPRRGFPSERSRAQFSS